MPLPSTNSVLVVSCGKGELENTWDQVFPSGKVVPHTFFMHSKLLTRAPHFWKRTGKTVIKTVFKTVLSNLKYDSHFNLVL